MAIAGMKSGTVQFYAFLTALLSNESPVSSHSVFGKKRRLTSSNERSSHGSPKPHLNRPDVKKGNDFS